MLTRTKVFSLTIAALLLLTLAPGGVRPTTAAPPEPLRALSDVEAAESYLSASSAPSAVQAPGATTRVSVASDGSEGNSYSNSPSISSLGRCVAFMSDATNLVGDDTNDKWDIFAHCWERFSVYLPLVVRNH